MKPEDQRMAIAEACGWTSIRWGYGYEKPSDTGVKKIPDYLTDLNAMHEVEKVLTKNQCYQWRDILDVLAHPGLDSGDKSIHFGCGSTAAIRAEAFLRTIDKWPKNLP